MVEQRPLQRRHQRGRHARRLADLAEQRADGTLADRDWLRAVAETLDPYLGNEAARDGAGGAGGSFRVLGVVLGYFCYSDWQYDYRHRYHP